MRNRLIFLAAAVVISGCADDQHTTAPASRSGLASRSVSGNGVSTNQGVSLPTAKPTDQVGFTKVFTVAAPQVIVLTPSNNHTGTATCPAGSHVIGGYHQLVYGAQAVDFLYSGAGFDGLNGWAVTGAERINGVSPEVVFSVTAICIQ